jgi:hypothetical protein
MVQARKNSGAPRMTWQQELPPVLAVAGLAADYLSPPAAWTMVLPFVFSLLLLGLGRRGLAAAVFLLSSWFVVPVAAQTVVAVEELRGEHHLLVIPGATIPSVDDLATCPALPKRVRFEVLPIGPGHLLDPHWVLRDVLVTFVDLHNALVIDGWNRDAGD